MSSEKRLLPSETLYGEKLLQGDTLYGEKLFEGETLLGNKQPKSYITQKMVLNKVQSVKIDPTIWLTLKYWASKHNMFRQIAISKLTPIGMKYYDYDQGLAPYPPRPTVKYTHIGGKPSLKRVLNPNLGQKNLRFR